MAVSDGQGTPHPGPDIGGPHQASYLSYCLNRVSSPASADAPTSCGDGGAQSVFDRRGPAPLAPPGLPGRGGGGFSARAGWMVLRSPPPIF